MICGAFTYASIPVAGQQDKVIIEEQERKGRYVVSLEMPNTKPYTFVAWISGTMLYVQFALTSVDKHVTFAVDLSGVPNANLNLNFLLPLMLNFPE